MNKIIVSGRLVRDVEIGDTKNGIRRALFTIASNNKTKDAEGNLQAIFLRCIAWRQNAEIIAKYLKKQTVKFETFILLQCSQFSTFLGETGNGY